MKMIDTISIKNQKNMQEYSDHYLFIGENELASGDDHVERIGEIQDHPLYNLVDDKNKNESEGKSVDKPVKKELTKKSTIMGNSFFNMKLPPRELILSPWLRAGSLGYIFGKRGSGKTWLAWKMAINISKGEDFGPWKCEKPWRTLYVDGEMPLGAMQERLRLLDKKPGDNLFIIRETQNKREKKRKNLREDG